jgi:glycosyltransferase involved in cell wall biosynthesis
MRVALDVSAVPAEPAGAGRYIVELARRLPHAVDSLTVISRRGDSARWPTIAAGARVSAIVPDLRASRLIYEALRLGSVPSLRDVDVLHSPHYTMPRAASKPVAVTVHDMTFFTNPEWHEPAKVRFFRAAIRRAAKRAAAVICVSEFTARQLTEMVGTDRPLVIAPHGVDLDRFALNGAKLPDRHAPFVLFVGTLEPRKGLDVLLAAFTHLAGDEPELELWIAGQEGWGVGDTLAALDAHPYANRIRRLGYVHDDFLVSALRSASAVCYPSRGEGFGLPVLEALACGAPVVTTSSTVMEEVAGEAAWFAPVGDVVSLAERLDEVVHLDENTRELVRVRARARAEMFTWDRSIERHLEAYALAAANGP